MPDLPPLPEPAEERARNLSRRVAGLCIVGGLLLACICLYSPGVTHGGVWALAFFILAGMLTAVLPGWVCRRVGVSLERSEDTPFDLSAYAGGADVGEAELRRCVGREHLYRVAVFGVMLLLVPLIANPKPFWSAQLFVPLGLAALGLLQSLWGWHRAVKTSLVARADAHGLRSGWRNRVAWSQVARAARVQQFGVFGGRWGEWLVFRDADGAALAEIPLGVFAPEQEERFLGVVARYF